MVFIDNEFGLLNFVMENIYIAILYTALLKLIPLDVKFIIMVILYIDNFSHNVTLLFFIRMLIIIMR